jgi:hypothetical protein
MNPEPASSQKRLFWIPSLFALFVGFGAGFWFCQHGHDALKIRHPLGADTAPDGKHRAEYFWQYRDFLDWFLQSSDNPTLHLDLRELPSGRVIDAEDYLADVATVEEARDRFADKIPWNVREAAEAANDASH